MVSGAWTYHSERDVVVEVVGALRLDQFVRVGGMDLHLVLCLVIHLARTSQHAHHILSN